MSKAGRKRKEGKRTMSGQLSREGRIAAEAISPVIYRQLKDAMILRIKDPLWRSQIGQMFLDGNISEQELEAGKRLRNLAARYQKMLGTKGIKPVSFERVGASCDYDPDSPEGQQLSKAEQCISDDFENALFVLCSAGRSVAYATRLLCEDDCVLVPESVRLAKYGLAALACHFGLTKRVVERRK